MPKPLQSRFVDVGDTRIHYLEAGSGEPVLFLHGWPTSSFLWRNIANRVADGNRAIAIDLPGFGRSDKPLNASYSFRYFNEILDGFLAALQVNTIGLAVHDIGGPIGLYWGSQNPERVRSIALLNTLLYPKASWAVILFVFMARTPGVRQVLASPWGLRRAIQFGIHDEKKLSSEALDEMVAPFAKQEAREALLRAGSNLHPDGFKEIARYLTKLEVPVQIVYGEDDWILPDVAKTMSRVKRDAPHAEVTALGKCGHFLQEERPDEIADILAGFFVPKA